MTEGSTLGNYSFASRMIVATTEFGKNAEEALIGQHIPVQRLDVGDLERSPIDWALFSLKHPNQMKLRVRKRLRPHQHDALTRVMEGFAQVERGKMIMACGTGKTFTALKIAEQFAANPKPRKYAPEGTNGMVLFLVPSLALFFRRFLRTRTVYSPTPLGASCTWPLGCFTRKLPFRIDAKVIGCARSF